MGSPTANERDIVPGRTLGFSVMSVLTLMVAFFLFQQGTMTSQSDGSPTADNIQILPGFLPEAWFLADDDSWGFVEIPAGTFTMGSNPALDRMAYENERWSRTRRQGEVNVPTFYISRFETTVAQYAAYVQDTGTAAPATPLSGDGALPVTNITWPEALAYTRWLDNKLRTSPETPSLIRQFLDAGGRVGLPSEAEWEKAARGSDGRIFPWRDAAPDEVANYSAAAPREVNAVNCTECAFGLSDMAGNVWEFTRSPLQDYPYTEEDDASNLSGDALFVMRGGSFSDPLNNIRAAIRGGIDPGVRNPGIGFRVAISHP